MTTAVVENPFGFGRVVRDKSGMASLIVEEKDASPAEHKLREINLGVYAARAGHLFAMLDAVGDGNAKKEFYFTDVLWPDFDEAALDRALENYAQRERRFGMTGEQVRDEGGNKCA